MQIFLVFWERKIIMVDILPIRNNDKIIGCFMYDVCGALFAVDVFMDVFGSGDVWNHDLSDLF